jgi:tRNA pseudouridine synthase 10
MTNLESIAEEIAQRLEQYDFDTFLVGSSVPHVILDREDEFRSKFKIKGRDSIKSQISKILSEIVVEETGKAINYAKPDVTVLVSMGEREISISARSVWLTGRYLKLTRGLSQRSSVCNVCNGLGCAQCDYNGKSLNSVQAKITEFLTKTFSAESCNFVWLGSEDEKSLVLGTGRPFYVEIIEPRKRPLLTDNIGAKGRKTRKIRNQYRSKDIQIKDLRKLDRRITDIPQFEITARVNLRKRSDDAEPLSASQADAIEKNFHRAQVNVRLSRKFRTVQKEITNISCRPNKNGDLIELMVECDGGIPLKKLITGQDETVRPNLSQFLSSYEIDPERPFDIEDVRVKESFRIRRASQPYPSTFEESS